jgi:hypothetical protein
MKLAPLLPPNPLPMVKFTEAVFPEESFCTERIGCMKYMEFELKQIVAFK